MKRLKVLTFLAAGFAQGVACGHTQEWYADNIEAAKAKQAECMRRLRADEQLSKEDRAECQRASAAILRAGSFVKSQPRSW